MSSRAARRCSTSRPRPTGSAPRTTRSAARRTTPSDATNGAPRPKVPGSRAPLRTPTRSPTDHVLAALRRGVLNQRNWSARGRDAGIADPDAEIKTIMRILGPEDDEEAPQDHEQAASATPAPGAREDPGERATSAPAPRRKNRGVGAERAEPAELAQVEPAEPPDPSALRAVFEGLVGGRREWRDRGDR